MLGTKIARPRDGRHKNNSPKGWMGGELHGRHENNSPVDGELNGRHENNSPQGMDDTKISRQTDGRVESQMVGSKIICQMDGQMES